MCAHVYVRMCVCVVHVCVGGVGVRVRVCARACVRVKMCNGKKGVIWWHNCSLFFLAALLLIKGLLRCTG